MKLAVARRLSGAVGSLVVWAVHFVAAYVLVGIGCDRGWNVAPLAGTNALTFSLIALTVPALGLIAWFGWTGWRSLRAAGAEAARAAPPRPDAPDGEVRHARTAAAAAAAPSPDARRGSGAGVASIAVATGDAATAKRTRFLGALTLALAGIAFIATTMTALPMFMLPHCQ